MQLRFIFCCRFLKKHHFLNNRIKIFQPLSTGKWFTQHQLTDFYVQSRPNAEIVAATTNGGANKWAIGNYGGNFFIFGDRNALSTEGKTRLSMLTDGLSQTIMFAERYGTCGSSGKPNDSSTWGNLWADSNLRWRPTLLYEWRTT